MIEARRRRARRVPRRDPRQSAGEALAAERLRLERRWCWCPECGQFHAPGDHSAAEIILGNDKADAVLWLTLMRALATDERDKGHGGKYVMARLGDAGPYAVGNVQIITNSENVAEGNLGNQRAIGTAEMRDKLSEAQRRRWYRHWRSLLAEERARRFTGKAERGQSVGSNDGYTAALYPRRFRWAIRLQSCARSHLKGSLFAPRLVC